MKDQYRNIAKWYDKIFEPLNSGLRNIGLKMYPVNEGMTVLDIGCGTGAHLRLYQKENCSIYGIDLSPAMINVARKTLGEEANISLGSATDMEFGNDQFDLILCSTVLHEMSQKVREDVLEEAKRVLKSDGRILLIDFHPGPIKMFKGVYSKIIITISEVLAGREHYRNYRHYMRNGGLPGLIDSMGFEIEDRKIVSGGNFGIFLLKKKI
jgi:ubiquinone/menaquinone biosynthesis C-methylase UbiE